MTDLPPNHEGIRLYQLSLQPQHNTAFGEYVQSHAFNLALSKRMISVLVHFHDNQQVLLNEFRYPRQLDVVTSSRSLVARGLLIHHREWIDSLPKPHTFNDSTEPLSRLWEVTTAGKLVVQLLVEAGMIAPDRRRPLPPPPPGWIDPRIKLEI